MSARNLHSTIQANDVFSHPSLHDMFFVCYKCSIHTYYTPIGQSKQQAIKPQFWTFILTLNHGSCDDAHFRGSNFIPLPPELVAAGLRLIWDLFYAKAALVRCRACVSHCLTLPAQFNCSPEATSQLCWYWTCAVINYSRTSGSYKREIYSQSACRTSDASASDISLDLVIFIANFEQNH